MSEIVRSGNGQIQSSKAPGIELNAKLGDVQAKVRVEKDNLQACATDGSGNAIGMKVNW